MDVAPAAPYRTPHKAGRLLLAPTYRPGDFRSHAVDCPFPFFHDGRYFMTYVGWDGTGYRTGLAVSDDLENWQDEGLIIDRGEAGSPTQYNVALTCILRDNELHGPGTLKRVDGRFLGTYHAYPNPGYEEGGAVIGLCHSDDLRHWQLDAPILQPEPTCAWEAGGLYKSWLVEHYGTYFIFYNAKTKTSGWPWIEQTGVVTSKDLVQWTRYPGNPILPVGSDGEFDDIFASDPVVLRDHGRWLMFYFGNGSDGHARDSLAFSDDLFHWTKSGEILIDVGGEGSIDSLFAHKPGIITRDGKLYHFYCAVQPAAGKMGGLEILDRRGITLATS